ncbi:hypothetical protein [Amycolatopsis sp. H20-H5]|uniref:hypothetical protein n=1 Tax=Amycolatopsis sp. H20-H5 TaxID=3046309 RepID=UPI002DB9F13B|nr:hypothetical protein [Amycolatopsis sp. H20-H5]MEC3974598.1 hypothetical protein [Amycolatopsis sp. H20-H5]
MAKALIHDGTKSWWNGKVTTLCGLVFESGNSERLIFTGVSCPVCKAIKKAK